MNTTCCAYKGVCKGIDSPVVLFSSLPGENRDFHLYMYVYTEPSYYSDHPFCRFSWQYSYDDYRHFAGYPLSINPKGGSSTELASAITLAMNFFMSEYNMRLDVNTSPDGEMIQGIIKVLEKEGMWK